MVNLDKKLIIGNWKMSPSTLREAKMIFGAIKKKAARLGNVQTVICPPFLYIEPLRELGSGHSVVLGAQDLFWEDQGAYTGEISASQLAESKVQYVILGHSELRAQGETNKEVAKKIKAAFRYNIKPILCVGESVRDEKGEYLHFLKEELEESLAGIPKNALSKIIIAYEPIWAVGKDALRQATPEECRETSVFIRKVIHDLFGEQASRAVTIIYGGSVDEKDAEEFLRNGGVTGLLVGRASLNPGKFVEILHIANNL